MPGPMTREEFDELADEVRGEKVVRRHILEQTRQNSDDLAGLKTRMIRVEDKVDGLAHRVDRIEQRLGGVESDLGSLKAKVDGLTQSLPRVIGDVMREVMAEERSRKG